MPFILRQWTLQQRTSSNKSPDSQALKVKHKISTSNYSAFQNEKIRFQNYGKDKESNYSRKKSINEFQLNNLKEIQLQKYINQNGYTINLSQNYLSDSLPKIKTIEKAQRMLISDQAFQHYKKINSENGIYNEALFELQKNQQQNVFKLKISNRMKIKTRKNIFQLQKKEKSESFKEIIMTSNSQKFHLNSRKFLQPIKETHLKKYTHAKAKSHIGSSDKWKLTDFLDPIVMDQETDQADAERLRRKCSILKKLKKITLECQLVEDQQNVKVYLDLFAKYNSKVESKLVKKQRQLQKVQSVFQRSLL